MCSYRVLFQNDETGYITQCKTCKHFQLAFGTVFLHFSQESFPRFISMIQAADAQHQHQQHSFTTKNITIPLPAEGAYLLFSRAELSDLCNMLEQADTEMRALQLLELFPS